MTYLEEYHNAIQSGELVCGYWVKKQVRRLVDDLSNERYVYDTAEAHKRIRFMETLCLQSKQPYYMKPVKLMLWQKAWWEAVYSFKMADTGKRRFTEGLLEVARKNGKSTMFAADGMADLFIGEGGMDICCASNDDRQAKLIWSEIGGMRSRLDPKKAITSQNLTEIKNKARGTTVFRLSSKTQNKDGFNISKTYLDESHDIREENGQSEVAEACWRGMSAKEEPLFLNCTTQGFNRGCYLDKKLQMAKEILEGEWDDEHFIAFLYEQDSEQEIWQNPASWAKSNPSLPYGVKKVAQLERDVEKSKHDKATRVHMLTKDFNMPQSEAVGWLMLEDYDYPMNELDTVKFKGVLMLGAVDLSATTDLSCAKALFKLPDDRTKYVLTKYFIPESKLTDSNDKEAGADYEEWARLGFVEIHEGNEVDISRVADWFYELFKEYGLRPYKIGYDQRYAKTFIERCGDYGFDTEMLIQGRALSNAMKLTEADFRGHIINYGDNPVDRWCLGNCCFQMDNVGNIQPVKQRGHESRRIDGAVTLIMAEEMYRRYKIWK